MMQSTIVLTVYYENEIHTLQTYEGEYRSLMALLYDKIFIDDFGECRGMGRCGTCLIKLLNSKKSLTLLERNEESTLEKMEIQEPNIHLSCQIVVDETLHEAEILIISL